jgi:phage tail-like protein
MAVFAAGVSAGVSTGGAAEPSYPFTAFNFAIEITVNDRAPACNAAFSECDGLEISQEIKTIREGGNNGVQFRLAGPATYGTLTLKRGMTGSYDLWEWFEQALQEPSLRAHAAVVLLTEEQTEQVRFVVRGCRPVKLKAPALNAKDGMIAIEEMQVAYESFALQQASGSSGA